MGNQTSRMLVVKKEGTPMEAFGCKELALAAKAAGSGDTQWVMLSIINQEECRPSVVALPTGNFLDSEVLAHCESVEELAKGKLELTFPGGLVFQLQPCKPDESRSSPSSSTEQMGAAGESGTAPPSQRPFLRLAGRPADSTGSVQDSAQDSAQASAQDSAQDAARPPPGGHVENTLQVRRAQAMGNEKLALGGPTLDAAECDIDLTTMPVNEIERRLMQGAEIPGWSGHGNPQRELGYLKLFFSARTMAYHAETLWPATEPDAETRRLVQQLSEQLALMSRHGDFNGLSEQSNFDMKVVATWTRHMMSGVVPHGPLLGHARMMKHELYYHLWSEDQPPFLMARVPGLAYAQYPFFAHAKDITEGVRELMMQTGLWRAPALRIPRTMALPSQSAADLNDCLLNTLFPDKQGLPKLPEGILLRVLSPEVKAHARYQLLEGAPPAGGDSLFFDNAPNRSWYLQGTRRGSGGQLSLDWVRRADVPGRDTEFGVLAVCPAEAPDLNGFGKFQYFRGVYISEGGVLKALWLELVNREHVRGREPNYLHLFAASQVTPEMLNSVVNRGPAGQGFEQRRSRGGWVVQGPRPKRVCMGGWVWQEPYNGAVTYYHVPKDSDTVFTFKQWSQDGASWHWSEETEQYEEVHEADNTWHFTTVAEWFDIRDFIGRRGGQDQAGQPEAGQPEAGNQDGQGQGGAWDQPAGGQGSWGQW
ncbi:unnamed protein product [Effrenium voratum]|nr:unnamed protein product [Effrenium voratum]